MGLYTGQQDGLGTRGLGRPNGTGCARTNNDMIRLGADERGQGSGPSGGGGGRGGGGHVPGRDAGPAKETALLKAAVESLRASNREKEDVVTELVRALTIW